MTAPLTPEREALARQRVEDGLSLDWFEARGLFAEVDRLRAQMSAVTAQRDVSWAAHGRTYTKAEQDAALASGEQVQP